MSPDRQFTPRADLALTVMVMVIVVDLFVFAPAAAMLADRHWPGIVVAGVMMVGVLVVWGNLWLSDLFVASCVAGIALRLAHQQWGGEGLEFGYLAVGILADLVLGYLFARRVFAPGRINVHRLQGAAAIYLIAGHALSQAFHLVSAANAGAFLVQGAPLAHAEAPQHLLYYSFVVITTLGFGDVVPVHPHARMLSVLGAVFGTLYPAILIGRLVGGARQAD